VAYRGSPFDEFSQRKVQKEENYRQRRNKMKRRRDGGFAIRGVFTKKNTDRRNYRQRKK
jgi:hypothetical protein